MNRKALAVLIVLGSLVIFGIAAFVFFMPREAEPAVQEVLPEATVMPTAPVNPTTVPQTGFMELAVDEAVRVYCNPQVDPCVRLCYPVGMYQMTTDGPMLLKDSSVYQYFYDFGNGGLARVYDGQPKPAIELWMEGMCGYSFPNLDPALIRQGIHSQTCSTGGQADYGVFQAECP